MDSWESVNGTCKSDTSAIKRWVFCFVALDVNDARECLWEWEMHNGKVKRCADIRSTAAAAHK